MTLFGVVLSGAALPAQTVEVSLDTGGEEWIARDRAISLEVVGWPAEGRLAILIGETDATDLFRQEGDRLHYRPELLELPIGETELVVFLAPVEGEWLEVARHPLKVLRPGGVEQFERTSTLDLEARGIYDPDRPDDAEQIASTFSGQANLQLSAVRSQWTLGWQMGVMGVSEHEQALRFADQGDSAPLVDLSSYLATISRGRGRLEVGQVSIGSSRQLIESFSSRGVSLALPLGPRLDLSTAAVNGTQIVGWDNPLGLSDRRHRAYSAALGAEVLSRPGGLRVVATLLDASILPLSNFDEGSLEDREESSGWSATLATSTPGGRFAFRGGFARSTFDNPEDPLLSQGSDLVAVDEETRDALYAEIDITLVRGVTLGEDVPVSLDLALKHQRVDPLYRSIGASVPSDVEESGAEIRAGLGQFTAQAGHIRSEDNLDDIASILKTKTRQDSGALFLPLASAIKSEQGVEQRWLPALSYSYGRVHQFGDSLPVGGGFSESHVPDQVSSTHGLSLDWQGNRWRLNAVLGLSDQDNRQPGRETSDFEALTESLSLSSSPHARVDLAFNLGREESKSLGTDQQNTTDSYGLSLNWRPHPKHAIEALATRSESGNTPRTQISRSTTGSVQWVWQLGWSRGSHGINSQFHLLYSMQSTEARDLIFAVEDEFDTWTVSSGFSISIY